MMIIDHIAAGIIVPQAKGFNNWIAVSVGIFSSMLPDLPVIISGWKGSIGYLSHRSATHSLVLAPLFSLIPLLILYIFFKSHIKNSLLQLYLISLISYSIHILFDLITPFGTQLFYPLYKKQFSFDLLHSFDPLFMVISASIIITFLLRLKSRKFLTFTAVSIFIMLYVLYSSVNLIRKSSNSSLFKNHLITQYPKAQYIKTIPRTFWRWKGIGKSSSEFFVVASESGKPVVKSYNKNTNIPESVKKEPYYSKFMNYARFPVIEKKPDSFEIHNLIYSPDSYRLILEISTDNKIKNKKITGFNLEDDNI